MVEVVYIQKVGGEFINETAFTLWNGCKQLCIPTEPFEAASFWHVSLTKETMVHGYVSVVKAALRSLGAEPRDIDGQPPDEIREFYGRRLWATTMEEVRAHWHEGRRVFVKPLNVTKAFTGFVTTGTLSDFTATSTLPDDFEVLCSEPVEFISEYRLFVNRGMIIDCRRYRGDYRRVVDVDTTATAILAAFKSAPISWALDLGLTADGRTLIVEVGDAYSLGCYGMPAIPYAQMIIDRWEEMVGDGMAGS